MIRKLQKHANKILYVGAGYHIEPVIHFPETKQFVFIDTQPRSPCEDSPKFKSYLYRPNFISDLIDCCQYYGFDIESCSILDKKYYKKIVSNGWYYLSCFFKIPNNINPTMLVFFNKNTQQKIVYYVSTNIKFNMNKQLLTDISTCDGIIISGYHPETELLQYFTTPKAFFGYSNTSYVIDTENLKETDNTIIYFLHNCICNTPYYFTDFYLVYNDSGVIVNCHDFTNFIETLEYHNDKVRKEIYNDDPTLYSSETKSNI
jgi:hypothetical protein